MKRLLICCLIFASCGKREGPVTPDISDPFPPPPALRLNLRGLALDDEGRVVPVYRLEGPLSATE